MARSRGSIRPRKLSDGRQVYDVVFELPHGLVGHRRKKWIRGFPSKRAAQVKLTESLHSLDAGTFVEPTTQTVAQYMKAWLDSHRVSVRPSTWVSYRNNLKNHVLPRLGTVPLQRPTASPLNSLYADLLEAGRSDGKGGLSPRSVRYIHTIVRKALADAFRRA